MQDHDRLQSYHIHERGTAANSNGFPPVYVLPHSDFPTYSLDEILNHKVEMPLDFHPLPLFREYLAKGYYPFSHLPGYELRLQQVMTQTLEVDIPQYAGMNVSTSRKLARLLAILSESAPYKPCQHNPPMAFRPQLLRSLTSIPYCLCHLIELL